MKPHMIRNLTAVLCLTAGFSSGAPTRLGSLHFESYNALQAQIFRAAEIFEAPELAALPMLMSRGLPGGVQVNKDTPLALHVFSDGDEPAVILEVTAAGLPEAYLRAMLGEGATLAPPEAGLYRLGSRGTARIDGKRVFIAMKPDPDTEALLSDPSLAKIPLPDIPGAIRLSVVPGALATLLDSLKEAMNDLDAPVEAQTVTAMLDLQKSLLAQVKSGQIGIGIVPGGLSIRTRHEPVPGSEVATLIASFRPVTASQMSFIEKDTLFSLAVGGLTLPPGLAGSFRQFYTQAVSGAPGAGLDAAEASRIIDNAMRQIGAPAALSVRAPAALDAALAIQGMLNMSTPAEHLAEQLAMLQSPAMQRMSALKYGAPVERLHQGIKIFTVKPVVDDEALKQTMQAAPAAGAPDEDAFSVARGILHFFEGTQEYAATPQAMVFGGGGPGVVETAIAKATAAAPDAGTEARRISAAFAVPASAQWMTGRLSLSGIARQIWSVTQGEAAPKLPAGTPRGEGLIFTSWVAGGAVNGALLLPPSEVRELKVIGKLMQDGANGDDATTAPPPAAPEPAPAPTPAPAPAEGAGALE